jgi:hypothetical protein
MPLPTADRYRPFTVGVPLLAAVLVCFGCTTARNLLQAPVTHNRGLGSGYPGYSIDLVSATPAPGTALKKGSTERFSVRVRYVLQSRETGRIALFFLDESGTPLLSGKGTGIEIVRGKSQVVDITHEVVVPEVMDLILEVVIIPEGLKELSRVYVHIRYPVSR